MESLCDAALRDDLAFYRDALRRISLGRAGRKTAGLRDNERLKNAPDYSKHDWVLAEEALRRGN